VLVGWGYLCLGPRLPQQAFTYAAAIATSTGTSKGSLLKNQYKFPRPPIRLSRSVLTPIPGSRPGSCLGSGVPSRLIYEPAVAAKPASISPDNCWLSLAESDGPVAMLFLELNAESSPTTTAVLHSTTSGKITSDLQGNSTREIKGDTG